MIHPLHKKWAKLLVHYCCEVKAGDVVPLHIDLDAKEMARALFREVFSAGATPVLHMTYPEQKADLLELAPDSFYKAEAKLEMFEIQNSNAWIYVRAPRNTKGLQTADKTKLSLLQQKMRPVNTQRVNHTNWVLSLYPTEGAAQDAGMSTDDYEKFVYSAMYLFDDDPVAKWNELHDFQATLIERLAQANEVHIQAEGTDLKLRTKGRTWLNSDGHRNMPSGEVFTGPLEDSATGHIHYTVPSNVSGVDVEGIRLEFKDGKIIKAKADKGDDLLQAQLDTDEGARFLGELGIGTNYQIQTPTKSILFDEKIGGTVHLAAGNSYESTGGTNKSAIHWDMICDLRQGGTVHLDGELFQENGEFKV